MTPIVGRLIIAWSLLAYGVGAFVGPTLHALPGCDHHDTGGSSSHAPDSSSTTHDDCLICQAIGAASIPLAALSAPLPERIVLAEVATTPLAPPRLAVGLHAPRAPPGDRSACVA